jgi:hypothetical protein
MRSVAGGLMDTAVAGLDRHAIAMLGQRFT